MKPAEILLTIDSLREQDLSFAEIVAVLTKEGVIISESKVWYLATYGSRRPGFRVCMGPNCKKEIRKISNTKYCSMKCAHEAMTKRMKERRKDEGFMEVAD